MKTYDLTPKYYVYAYKRTNNSKYGKAGTFYYIGKGSKNRYKEDHGNIKVPNDPHNIEFFPPEKNLIEEEAFKLEVEMIKQYGRIKGRNNGIWSYLGGILENLSEGGKQPPNLKGYKRRKKRIWTDEARANLSKALKGKVKSKEHLENIVKSRKANNTNWFSKEDKEKMSKTRKELAKLPEFKIAVSKAGKGNKGKTKSPVLEETRKKISEKVKQRWKEGAFNNRKNKNHSI